MLAVAIVMDGLEWRAWIPVFSVVICLYVVILLAVYDYLAQTHYTLAKIGFALWTKYGNDKHEGFDVQK